jgi:hypothetical protein
MVLYKTLWWCPCVYIEFKEYEKRFQLPNIYPKPASTTSFWASLLMIRFEDLNLIFYVWVFNTTIEVIMKKKNQTNLNNKFSMTFRSLTHKIMVFVYRNTLFLSTLPCSHPNFNRFETCVILDSIHVIWEELITNL